MTSHEVEPGRLVLVAGRDPVHSAGGSGSYVVAVAKAAMLAGYEPHVFSIAPRSEVTETDFGVVHRVASPIRPPRSITAVLQRPWLVPAIVSFLELEPGPHLIHGFGSWADPVLTSSELLARRGVKTVPIATAFMAIEHEAAAKLQSTIVRRSVPLYWRHQFELHWARRVTAPRDARAYRRMWTVVVNYDSVCEILQRPYGPLPIRKLPYSTPSAFDAVSADSPIPAPLAGFGDPSAPLIVSVSRHDGRKGLDVLIRALARLRDRGIGFRACLVGPGVLLSAHRRYVRSLGLQSQVLVPGRVPEVMPYLVAADVYALPSLEEASGSLAVLEALQAGAPIIATAIDGLPEDLEHDGNALLVPAGDDEVLAGGLVRLLQDPALRTRLSAAARTTYERRFAPEISARALASLYQEAGLAPSRKPALQARPR